LQVYSKNVSANRRLVPFFHVAFLRYALFLFEYFKLDTLTVCKLNAFRGQSLLNFSCRTRRMNLQRRHRQHVIRTKIPKTHSSWC